jgi:hypothetical protein
MDEFQIALQHERRYMPLRVKLGVIVVAASSGWENPLNFTIALAVLNQ